MYFRKEGILGRKINSRVLIRARTEQFKEEDVLQKNSCAFLENKGTIQPAVADVDFKGCLVVNTSTELLPADK